MLRAVFAKLIIVITLLLMVSCGYTDTSKSSATGWGYNDPAWGGYQVVQGTYNQPVPARLSFIQGGSFVMGKMDDNVMFEYDNIARKVTVNSFYMDQVETPNVDYNEYLYWLERIYGQEYPEVVKQAQPDYLTWNSVMGFRDPLTDNYFQHPAYQNYPVVGVSWEQASDYASWRTDRVNELILVNARIIDLTLDQTPDNNFNTEAYLTGQYEASVRKGLVDMNPNAEGEGKGKTRGVQLRDGIFIEKFRLPTEAEWEYAAYASLGNTVGNRVLEKGAYPWNGSSVRYNKDPYIGVMRANFTRASGDAMGIAGNLNDGAPYTAEVFSYFPNDFGLYNMAGNVSEWVLDVYRPLTFENSDHLDPFRGNNYLTTNVDEDGIAVKDSLGRIQKRTYTEEELANRRNFNKSDNVNYLDGDYESVIVDNWLEKPENPNTTEMVYEFGKNSLVTNKSRVVKGGSWKDRASALSPGKRRFLEQDLSAPWIGFRCAMSRVGSSVGGNVASY